MEEHRSPFRNIKIVLRPSPRKLKILLIVLIVFSTLTLVTLGVVRHIIQVQTQNLLDQAAALEQENEDLGEKIDDLGSEDSVRDIAEDELGLVDPDTVIINPNS